MEGTQGAVLGIKHGHALLLGFGAVIVGKILAAAIAKYLGFAM